MEKGTPEIKKFKEDTAIFSLGEEQNTPEIKELREDTAASLPTQPHSSGIRSLPPGCMILNRYQVIKELGLPQSLEAKHWYRLIVEVNAEGASFLIPEITGLATPLPEPTCPPPGVFSNPGIGIFFGKIYLDNYTLECR